MTIDKFLLYVALPAVVAASLIEALVLSRRAAYPWKAMGVSLVDLATRVSVTLFLPLSIATWATDLAQHHRLATIELESWEAILLLFVGQEFCYYWYHRAARAALGHIFMPPGWRPDGPGETTEAMRARQPAVVAATS